MTTDDTEADRAKSRAQGSRWRWLLIGGVAVVVLVVAAWGLFVLGHITGGGDAPSFPSMIDHPDPTIQGTVAYVDTESCVRVVSAGGGPSRQLLCLPPLDPTKAKAHGKPIGPQLVWLPDGRLEVTMINMDVTKPTHGQPPDLSPSWQKIIEVRTGTVTDVPADQVPTTLNLTTRPVVSPTGERIRFTSNSQNGHVTVALTDAKGNSRTLLDVNGPGEYTYGLRSAFWSPDYSYVVADDSRILIITVDKPSKTRQLVPNPNVFGDNPRQAGFAVTAQNLLPTG
jgi:hypothetical protein